MALFARKLMSRDPAQNALKKPPNAFMLFCQHNRAAVIADDPRLPATEQSKRLSRQWKELSDSEKDVFRKQAQDLYQRFQEQNPDYRYKQRVKTKKTKIGDQLSEFDSLQLLNHMFQNNPLLLQQILSEQGEQDRPNVCKLFSQSDNHFVPHQF
jgi:hypothetical protein